VSGITLLVIPAGFTVKMLFHLLWERLVAATGFAKALIRPHRGYKPLPQRYHPIGVLVVYNEKVFSSTGVKQSFMSI
jgi:hypothetical protein